MPLMQNFVPGPGCEMALWLCNWQSPIFLINVDLIRPNHRLWNKQHTRERLEVWGVNASWICVINWRMAPNEERKPRHESWSILLEGGVYKDLIESTKWDTVNEVHKRKKKMRITIPILITTCMIENKSKESPSGTVVIYIHNPLSFSWIISKNISLQYATSSHGSQWLTQWR